MPKIPVPNLVRRWIAGRYRVLGEIGVGGMGTVYRARDRVSGKVVSIVKDMPGTYGFILNRVFAAARREADKIVADGIATREDIDKAMMTGRNWPVGFYNSRGTRTGWL